MARIQAHISGLAVALIVGLFASVGYFLSVQFTGGFIYFAIALVALVGLSFVVSFWGDRIPKMEGAQEADRHPEAVLIGFGPFRAKYAAWGGGVGAVFGYLALNGLSIGLPATGSALSLGSPYLALDNKFIIIGLLAPGIEEMAFRGVFYSILYDQTRNVHLSAAVQSVFFSYYHAWAYGPYLQTYYVAAGLFGFVAAEVGAATGSLWAPWLAHTINNTIIFGNVYGFAVGVVQ